MKQACALALVMALASFVAADEPSPADDGKLLYSIYCTSCHGPEGRGDGPAAASIQPRPPDLTRLRAGNDGTFPRARVILSIDGRTRIPGHLRGDMPIWGLSLRDPGSDADQEREVGTKILKLVAYLESIQPKDD
jgi:mono/diheme cytochrome c family protein